MKNELIYPNQIISSKQEGMSLKEKLGYGIAVSLIVGAGFFFINRGIKKHKEKNQTSKVLMMAHHKP